MNVVAALLFLGSYFLFSKKAPPAANSEPKPTIAATPVEKPPAPPAPAISQERIQQENAAAKAQPVNLRGELAGEPIPIINGQFTVPLGAWAPASFVLP